jgi:hypothetical protein
MADVNVFIPPDLPVGVGGAAFSTVSSGAVIRQELTPLNTPASFQPNTVSTGGTVRESFPVGAQPPRAE